MTTTRIDLIRHGEPVGGKRYRGDQIDDPLNETGWQQMQTRIERIAALGEDDWDVIISSPLSRCQAFARHLGEQRRLPVQINSNIREIGFGRWEGLTHAEIPKQYPEEFAAFRADPVAGRPAGAESMHEFFKRVSQALDTIGQEHSGQRVLLVSHAVVMRAALAIAMDAPMQSVARIRTEYAAWLQLTKAAGEPWRLACLDNSLPNGAHHPGGGG